MAGYIIGIDQSTQGTKALLFNDKARLLDRIDLTHEQKVSPQGHISHDMEEIYNKLVEAVKQVIEKNSIATADILGIGISNQRETTVAWDRVSGKPICDAVVWQCARAEGICEQISEEDRDYIRRSTGIPLSPYFPAGKMGWILKHCREAGELAQQGRLYMGTVDSWLLFKLSNGTVFKTDYSNASRTQLFDLHRLSWDERICGMFGIPMDCLAEVCDSDSHFTQTDMEGLFIKKVPVHGVLGDSHGALFGQGCVEKGMVKATYGTGSSLMLNVGDRYVESRHGLITSLAWGIDGKVRYVLEGNLNYSGAVVTWLKEDMKLIESARETEKLAYLAKPEDNTYLVPAFSGLGAPYWNSKARATLWGMSRVTGKNEIVRAALNGIAYQITDILQAMEQDIGVKVESLAVDGGATGNGYLMQFQSDMADVIVKVPDSEELSGMGAAYLAGISLGVFTRAEAFGHLTYQEYCPKMADDKRKRLYQGWKEAVAKVL